MRRARTSSFLRAGARSSALAAVALLACACAANPEGARANEPRTPEASDERASPLHVFAEGLCPKLSVYAARDRAFVVYGTYGLDATAFALGAARDADVTPAQTFATLGPDGPSYDPAFFTGLPTTADGYVTGDVELGGLWPNALWLTRVETGRGGGGKGVLYERRRLYYSYNGKSWTLDARALDAATQGMIAPDLPEATLCTEQGPELHFATLATARLTSGDVLVAGRCEDELRRAASGVMVASFAAGERAWRVLEAPGSTLFRNILNVELVMLSRKEAYLYAYPPYERDEAAVYFVHYDGQKWSEVEVPFEGPLVSLAAADDGTLWAVARWRQLWRRAQGKWERVRVPAPRFASPPPNPLHLLEVRMAAGALWLHAAYPVALEGTERKAARGHVLYTTGPVAEPLFCDRRRPAAQALSDDSETLQGAEER